MAKSIMFVGTSSDAGKSTLCTAICRILYQDGYRVAPFKSQNMSLNSAATPSGREIGRAQAVQAEACGILPNEHMNPVLLKPTSFTSSQVIVQGRVYNTRSAREYFLDSKEDIWKLVVESYQFLNERHDIVVIEGAGSPVEMNLKPRDIVNMRVANMADANVILVADIERGGVFASVVGTLQLLPEEERARVKGIIINKFRGDPTLFNDGKKWIEDYTGVPIVGVLPYIKDLNIDEEDSLGIDSSRYASSRHATGRCTTSKGDDSNDSSGQDLLRIAIVQLPHISNFTDFDPLFLEPSVQAYFCQKPEELAGAHAVILPGTKNTISDLNWLIENGLADAISKMKDGGTFLFGICGGYQMLGEKIYDPNHFESPMTECNGLGVFDATTTLHGEKRTVLVKGKLDRDFPDTEVEGYEIHMGVTKHHGTDYRGADHPGTDCHGADHPGRQSPFAQIREWDSNEWMWEGHVAADGRYIGTYLHGILHNNQFRTMWLNRIRKAFGMPEVVESISMEEIRANAYDRLADITREHLDIPLLYRMLGLPEGIR